MVLEVRTAEAALSNHITKLNSVLDFKYLSRTAVWADVLLDSFNFQVSMNEQAIVHSSWSASM